MIPCTKLSKDIQEKLTAIYIQLSLATQTFRQISYLEGNTLVWSNSSVCFHSFASGIEFHRLDIRK